MLINGILYVPFKVKTQTIESAVLISPDMTGLIFGIDWMENQNCIFNCSKRKIQVRGEWIHLQREPTTTNLRRINVSEDVVLPPTQQTPVNARISRGKRMNLPRTGVLKSDQIEKMPHVYSVRCLIPLMAVDVKVALLNTKKESQVIPQGTELGEVHDVEEVRKLDRVEDEPVGDLTPPNAEALKKIMEGLPPDLTKDQRQKVWSLLVKYREIFSMGDYDIGRTDLVEYHIDTGNHRPICQPLRRHPFQRLEWIDKKVEEMRKHGIVEPAASPWASNLVLVKKKNGTLQFCIDYRRLNSVTRQDSYPLPLIDNCFNALSESLWYSTLDLRSGYYYIPIAKNDRDKSAFVTRAAVTGLPSCLSD